MVTDIRLSVVVIGIGLLLGVSLLIPFLQPPFGGHHYVQWVAAAAVILGIVAWRRRESGPVATMSRAVTVIAAMFLVGTYLIGAGSALVIRIFMSD